MVLQIIAVSLAALILTRNLPLALKPFFGPARERDVRAAIVPILSVLLALGILIMAMKVLHGPPLPFRR